jgi:hypothetical protein
MLRASPKSQILILESWLMRTLAGLRSRWMMSRLCRYFNLHYNILTRKESDRQWIEHVRAPGKYARS